MVLPYLTKFLLRGLFNFILETKKFTLNNKLYFLLLICLYTTTFSCHRLIGNYCITSGPAIGESFTFLKNGYVKLYTDNNASGKLKMNYGKCKIDKDILTILIIDVPEELINNRENEYIFETNDQTKKDSISIIISGTTINNEPLQLIEATLVNKQTTIGYKLAVKSDQNPNVVLQTSVLKSQIPFELILSTDYGVKNFVIEESLNHIITLKMFQNVEYSTMSGVEQEYKIKKEKGVFTIYRGSQKYMPCE